MRTIKIDRETAARIYARRNGWKPLRLGFPWFPAFAIFMALVWLATLAIMVAAKLAQK